MARRDLRLPVLLTVFSASLVLGLALHFAPRWSGDRVGRAATQAVTAQSREQELRELFHQGAMLLQQRRHAEAAATLARVLQLAPQLTEAQANMGFAQLGLGRTAAAREHFEQALRLNERHLNAYYGLALCLERSGDLDAALGAMRVYVHLAPQDDPYARKAWAAIWEWQAIRDEQRRVAVQ